MRFHSRLARLTSAGGAIAGITALLLFLNASPAFAICNPGRTADPSQGSHYQGGVQSNVAVQLGGAKINWYTPYVEQSQGSSSSAWQMLYYTGCTVGTSPYTSYVLAQAGFVQMPGDSQDSVFTEYGDCGQSDLYPVDEFRNQPRTPSTFNVKSLYVPGVGDEVQMYQGSTELEVADVSWRANSIAVAAETHDTNDQAYGGTNAQQAFANLGYYDTSGVYHTDALALTPNNLSSTNSSGLPWWSWMKMTVGNDAFYTYDSACSS